MQKSVVGAASVALCSLLLILLPVPTGRAAGLTVAKAQADASPFAVVWVDTDQGVSIDGDASLAMGAQYATSQWSILTNGQVTVSKDGKPLVAGFWISDQNRTYYIVHGRAGGTLLNAVIQRTNPHSTQGLAIADVTQASADGHTARTVHIEVSLTFDPQFDAPADASFGHFGP